MTNIGRRPVLSALLAIPVTSKGLGATMPDTVPPSRASADDSNFAGDGVTEILARYVTTAKYEHLPKEVCKQSVRALVNWMGVAIGGSREIAVEKAIAAIAPFSGPSQASVLGRGDRFDVLNTAFVNGLSSAVHDYDDTHLRTLIHPTGPVIAAALALAEMQPVSGKDFLAALIIGIEAACRIGNAVSPNHYDAGWHITGTVGGFGAAVAAGKLLGLNQTQMTWALGLAASQPVGLREALGSMTKGFHTGRAASNGLLAAFLASKDFENATSMIEGKYGWAGTLSSKQDFAQITDDLGKRFEAAEISFKPFACAVVLHPVIDAVVQLSTEQLFDVNRITSVKVKVHPRVLELAGRMNPRDGLEAKFSIYHAVAVAIIEGKAGVKQFTNRAVQDESVVRLRSKVLPRSDPAIKPDQAEITVTLGDGRILHKYVEHSLGTPEVPMSDDALEQKFIGLTDGILPYTQARRVLDLCWGAESLSDSGSLAKEAVI